MHFKRNKITSYRTSQVHELQPNSKLVYIYELDAFLAKLKAKLLHKNFNNQLDLRKKDIKLDYCCNAKISTGIDHCDEFELLRTKTTCLPRAETGVDICGV